MAVIPEFQASVAREKYPGSIPERVRTSDICDVPEWVPVYSAPLRCAEQPG